MVQQLYGNPRIFFWILFRGCILLYGVYWALLYFLLSRLNCLEGDTMFDPLSFVLDVISRLFLKFEQLANNIGAWDLLISMFTIYLSYRLLLKPLFNSVGSDVVK